MRYDREPKTSTPCTNVDRTPGKVVSVENEIIIVRKFLPARNPRKFEKALLKSGEHGDRLGRNSFSCDGLVAFAVLFDGHR